jgi:hypothetical protein
MLNKDEQFQAFCDAQLDQDYALIADNLVLASELAFQIPAKLTERDREVLQAMFHVAEDAVQAREVALLQSVELAHQVTAAEKLALFAEHRAAKKCRESTNASAPGMPAREARGRSTLSALVKSATNAQLARLLAQAFPDSPAEKPLLPEEPPMFLPHEKTRLARGLPFPILLAFCGLAAVVAGSSLALILCWVHH